MTNDIRRNWRIHGANLRVEDVNRILSEIAERFDQLEGYRGQGRFRVPPTCDRDAIADDELVRKSQLDTAIAGI